MEEIIRFIDEPVNCGRIILFLGLLFIGSRIWLGWKEDNDKYLKSQKEKGYFNIIQLTQAGKVKGELAFKEDIFCFQDSGKENYSYRYKWDVFRDINIIQTEKMFGMQTSIIISLDIDNQEKTLKFITKNHDDAIQIKNIAEEKCINYKRKIEVENLMKARYRSGDLSGITPSQFEKLIFDLFTSMGFYVEQTGRTGDEGIDLIYHDKQKNEKYAVQCKRYQGKVGVAVVRDFYGALMHNRVVDGGYIITTGEFTSGAYGFAINKPIKLFNKNQLAQLLKQFYK